MSSPEHSARTFNRMGDLKHEHPGNRSAGTNRALVEPLGRQHRIFEHNVEHCVRRKHDPNRVLPLRAVSISMQVPQKPSSVWADSTEISTWNYTNGALTITAVLPPSRYSLWFFQRNINFPRSELDTDIDNRGSGGWNHRRIHAKAVVLN